MRLPFTCLLALIGASLAQAERLIFLPIGDRYANRDVRAEAIWDARDSLNHRGYVGAGFGNAFDLELDVRRHRTGLDLAYNYIPAIPDFGFGISIGVQDVFNRTVDGRSAYVAVTTRVNNYDPANADTPNEFTFGFGTGRYRGLFVGTRLPFTNQIRLVAEHDSRQITAGLELALSRGLQFRWLAQGQETLLGASFSRRF